MISAGVGKAAHVADQDVAIGAWRKFGCGGAGDLGQWKRAGALEKSWMFHHITFAEAPRANPRHGGRDRWSGVFAAV